ncbi:hypothetical protein H696_04491 [Fonticula alba]|uniref:Acyl carrier protein n=1 Tax=Fonticula alba TaxID=691883 RepID=A0A058Z4N2_FONAL|nr:hypothetical protein H696_04491 [Fonticula alba]KCV69076.1 hypothetical protein H696_04491 [Fonticula alba]|eukprot:XP_009496647.1 hypothetical protein H696_04491 [Fonticula alba]
MYSIAAYSSIRRAGFGFRGAAALPQLFSRAYGAAAGLTHDEVESRVMNTVGSFGKIQPEQVSTSSHFVTDLGLDSLDVVDLVLELEAEFNIEIPDADAEKILCVNSAIKYIANNPNAH